MKKTVWKRVVERFGDPNRVARQLWWDAMREQIMREWIHTGVVVVGVAVVAICAVFGYRLIQATNQTLQALLAQQKPQEATLATLKVEVRRGSADGPAVTGQEISLSGHAFDGEEMPREINTPLDASGKAVFGPIRPGQYYLNFVDPETKLSINSEITLFAGEKEEAIIVPENKPVQVELRADMPPSSDDAHQLITAVASWTNDYMGRQWSRYVNLLLGATGMWELEEIQDLERVPADAWGRPLGDEYRVYRRAENPAVFEVIAQDISVQVAGRVLTSGLPDSNPRDYLEKLPDKFFLSATQASQSHTFHLSEQNTFVVPLSSSLQQITALEPRVCKLLECDSLREPGLAMAMASLPENTSCPEVFPVPEAGQGVISKNRVKGMYAYQMLVASSESLSFRGNWRHCGLLLVPKQLQNGLASNGERCLLALYGQSGSDHAEPMVLPLKASWDAIPKCEDLSQFSGLNEEDSGQPYEVDVTTAIRPVGTSKESSAWFVFDLTSILSNASPEDPVESLVVAMDSEGNSTCEFVSTQLSSQAAGSLKNPENLRPAFYVFSEPVPPPEPAAQ